MTTEKKKMVTAVFRNPLDAEDANAWLMNRGYMSGEINVLMSDMTRSRYFSSGNSEATIKTGTHAAEGMSVGGAIGTAVGATLAAIAAIGTSLAIPGLGMVIAGPIAAAFAGGGAGAVAGGLLGGLIGLGIPEPNAQAYHEALREGGVVLGVLPRSNEEVSEIRQYFEEHHGESVCYC
jgi:hypothetical protein